MQPLQLFKTFDIGDEHRCAAHGYFQRIRRGHADAIAGSAGNDFFALFCAGSDQLQAVIHLFILRADEKRLRVGSFYQVEITTSEEFDLYGKVVK